MVGVQETYENERRWIFGGFSASNLTPIDQRGPWSDETGNPRYTMRGAMEGAMEGSKLGAIQNGHWV